MSNEESSGKRTADWDPGALSSVPERMNQLKEMRTTCPIAYTSRGEGYWTMLKHADIKAAAINTQTFSNAGRRHGIALPPLEADPPEHRAFRFLLNPFFVPKKVQSLEPQVRAIADRLLEPLLASGGGDIAKDFSYPLPVLTLCALLDLPADIWPKIKQLSEESLGGESAVAEERELARAAHQQLMVYSRQMIADRKASPRDPSVDIPTAIVQASILGNPIDAETGAGMIRLLISAGHNSTTSALGNSLLYLAEHPAEQQALRKNPGNLPAAIEEWLRYETPVQSMPRYLAKDVELNGRQLRAGERLDLMFGSANRDEEIFDEADKCLLDRKPNRHIAFGHGLHTCLGAPVARMELRVALEQVLRKTTAFTVNGPIRRPGYHRLGVDSLPIAIQI